MSGYDIKMTIALMLRVIFPPLNEVTVFVIAVTLYSLFFYVDALPSPIEILSSLLEMATKNEDLVPGYFNFMMAVLILLVLVIVPLLLPFTEEDMRILCGLVIAGYALIVLRMTILNLRNNPESILNQLILMYTLAWILYVLFVVRFIEEPGFIIDDSQAEPLSASVAAVVSVAFVFVAIKFYSVDWSNAYVVGTSSSSAVISLIYRFAFEAKKD